MLRHRKFRPVTGFREAADQEMLATLPSPVVIDRFARSNASAGVNQPGFDVLLGLVKSGRAYVKISGAALLSRLRSTRLSLLRILSEL